MCILKVLGRIGASRHQAKVGHGGVSPYIHSVGTLEKVFRRGLPLGRRLKAHGVNDVEALSEGLLERYWEDRLSYHHDGGHARTTFLQEMSVVATLERGLSAFSVLYREAPVEYDYYTIHWGFARKAKILTSRSNDHANRAVLDVERLFAAIDDPRDTT
ncbi:MAG: hypothetical protein AB7E32_17795 [Desulfovibrio sp.]